MTGVYASAGLVVGLLLFGGHAVGRWLPRRVHGVAREALRAARACAKARVLSRGVAYGLVFQGLIVLSAWLVARSISLDVPFSTLVVTLALVVVLAVVPISIGGLGIREGGFVVLLGQAGVEATEAAVFSLLTGLAFAVASLPGAVLLLKRDKSRAEPGAPLASPEPPL